MRQENYYTAFLPMCPYPGYDLAQRKMPGLQESRSPRERYSDRYQSRHHYQRKQILADRN